MLRQALLWCVAALGLIANGISGKPTTLAEIASAAWKEQSIAILQKLLPTRDSVQALVSQVMALEADSDKEELAINTPEVVEYKFIDLRGDGGVQLVCSLDYSGRGRSTVLMVINDEQGQMNTAYLYTGGGGLGIGELKNVIQDLEGDGQNEILISYALRPASPTAPTPYLDHVYVYRGGELVQADRDFMDYYRGQLVALRQDFEALSKHAPPSGASQEEQDDCQKALDAKQTEIAALSKCLSEP